MYEHILESLKEFLLIQGKIIRKNFLSTSDIKFEIDKNIHRELKLDVDFMIEKEVISFLKKYKIPILSEELGLVNEDKDSEFIFIVDPLDGSFNFFRGLTPFSISIGLWKNNSPLWGIIYDPIMKELIWGGKEIGSYCNNKKIHVSYESDIKKSVICSGFPSRFNFEDKTNNLEFLSFLSNFMKVRMIGAASISLSLVAKGKVDAYFEENIMLWDVAAGIPIVQGAGGNVSYEKVANDYSLNVFASNGNIKINH